MKTCGQVIDQLQSIAQELNDKQEQELWNKLVCTIQDLEDIINAANHELNKIRKAIEEQL